MNIENKRNFGYINFPDSGGGFFANYFTVISNMITCHQSNLMPYVNSNKTAFAKGFIVGKGAPLDAENPWDWWFDQEIPGKEDNLIPISFSCTRNFSHSERVWRRSDIPYARSVADKYVSIKPHILKQVDDYYDNHFKNRVVLGVMARGSEMNAIHPQYGTQTIETWINTTKDTLRKYPEINTIFLVTEDDNYIEPFLHEFPDALYLKDVFRKTNEKLEDIIKWSLFYATVTPRENHSRILGEECLIQALLLSKCDYLVVKQCGTSTAAIFYGYENLKDVIYA